MTYCSLKAAVSSSSDDKACAFSRKIGPHQESDPNANDTHVKPRVIKIKLLLKDKIKITRLQNIFERTFLESL